MSRHAGHVVGVDLGGTNMQAAVVGEADAILGKAHNRTEASRGQDAVIETIMATVGAALDEAGLSLEHVSAIGIAAPGAIDIQSGNVITAPNLGWSHVPLRAMLEERFRKPIVVDNDVNAAAWGEFRIGAARPYRSVMAVWVGTGVGGGLILDDRLYQGRTHSAGEIGQTVVGPGTRAPALILEHHVSRVGMTRLAREWAADHASSPIAQFAMEKVADHHRNVPLKLMLAALTEQDPLALRIVDHASRHLGMAIANCVTLLGLEAVVIGGGVIEALGERMLEPTRTAFKESVFPETARETPLLESVLISDAGTIGAALLAREGVPTSAQ